MVSRRMIAVILIGAAAGIVIVAIILAVKSHRPTPVEVAAAQVSYKSDLASCLAGDFGPPNDGQTITQYCNDAVRLDNYTSQHQYSALTLPEGLVATSFILIVASLMIGASSIGAEWGAGSIPTLLVWESRRTRVILARLVAVVATVAVVTIVLQVAMSLVFYAVAATRGSTAGTDSVWMHHLLGSMARITLMSVLTAALGLAVATGGRSTTAALLFLVGYMAIFESLLHGLRRTVTPWLLGSSLVTYVSGHAQQMYLSDGRVLVISVAHSLLVVCGYVAGLLVLALALFKTRDIT